MNNEKFIQAIIEEIYGFDSNEMVQLNNIYCQENQYTDDEIYENGSDFFDTFFNRDVIEAVRAATYGEYNYNHNWVKFNGYGNLVTMDYVGSGDMAESVDTIAEHVAENFNRYDHLFELDPDDFEEEEETEEDESDDEVTN